jgi:hypothetical protein
MDDGRRWDMKINNLLRYEEEKPELDFPNMM